MGLAVYFVVVARRYCGRAVGKIGKIGQERKGRKWGVVCFGEDPAFLWL
jgi:hypothetical protein